MSKVLLEICVERAEQDRKRGGPAHDDAHAREDWLKFIEQHSRKVPFKAYESWELVEPAERAEAIAAYRKQMIRIAALAVAAVESFDRKHPPEPGDPTDGKTVMLPENTFLTSGGKPPPGWPEEERKAVYTGPEPDASPVKSRDPETRMATAPQAGDGAEIE